MLNKKICLKCSLRIDVPENTMEYIWKALGFVDCYSKIHEHTLMKKWQRWDIRKDPPEHCPYILEHILNAK